MRGTFHFHESHPAVNDSKDRRQQKTHTCRTASNHTERKTEGKGGRIVFASCFVDTREGNQRLKGSPHSGHVSDPSDPPEVKPSQPQSGGQPRGSHRRTRGQKKHTRRNGGKEAEGRKERRKKDPSSSPEGLRGSSFPPSFPFPFSPPFFPSSPFSLEASTEHRD